MASTDPAKSLSLNLASFDSLAVRAFAPPLVAALAIVLTKGPFGFLLAGFHVWIHEFGHATAAWLSGWRALPLPIGWTNVDFERSLFVYFGILALLGVLGWAGIRERTPLAIAIVVPIAVLQFDMTWRMSEHASRMWMIFAGVGGEFYLSTLMIILFFFRFPAKFQWGRCRYLFLFIGSSKLYDSFAFWYRVKRGLEGIPYGSMVNGEDDQNGDMNHLLDDYGWTQHRIMGTYYHLGQACLLAILFVYLVFATGLDEWIRDGFARCVPDSLKIWWEAGKDEEPAPGA